MKKTIITVVVTAVVAILATLLTVYAYNSFEDNKYDKLVAETGVKEVTENKYELPKFSIVVQGVYYSTISNVDVADLKTYNVEAVMFDGIYRRYNTYDAIKLKDVFELYGIEDYNNVVFKSNGNLQVKFAKDEISDNFFLTFTKDGFNYPENEPVNLLCPEFAERYSLTNIVRIDFE